MTGTRRQEAQHTRERSIYFGPKGKEHTGHYFEHTHASSDTHNLPPDLRKDYPQARQYVSKAALKYCNG